MKNLTLITILCIVSFQSKAQIDAISDAIGAATGGATNLVHDPANNAKLVEGLNQARKTYEIIKEEKELIEDAKNLLDKVSTSLRQVKYVDEIITIQDEVYKMQQENIEILQALNIRDDGYILNLIHTMNNTLISLESSLNLLHHLLTDDLFKMNTAERLEALRAIKKEAIDYRATARYLRRQITYYASTDYLNRLYRTNVPSAENNLFD